MSSQYPFDLAPSPDFSFKSFYVGRSNREAFEAVSSYSDWPIPILLLVGPAGCGKTHLGTAWARQNPDCQFIDVANEKDEAELFRALNQALNGDMPALLLSARTVPSEWKTALPDLRSRLKNVPVFVMDEPDEDILEPIIRKLFDDKGREVKADLVSYIYTHFDRSVLAVSALIDEIDLAASQAKKDVTRSFVADYINRTLRMDI